MVLPTEFISEAKKYSWNPIENLIFQLVNTTVHIKARTSWNSHGRPV
ncbi:MAG: hypothetical protein ACKVG2_02130 [Candidatus Poseidoniales archaeon]